MGSILVLDASLASHGSRSVHRQLICCFCPKLYAACSKGKKLSKQQRKKLRTEFDKVDEQLLELDQSIARVEKELKKLTPETTLVMQELESPRETFVMLRGDYESRGENVEAMTPGALPRDRTVAATGDRMELARWLTSAENPLLARVTVNRWWAEIFGVGLVPTLEDFGTQSDTPSHP